MEEYECRLLHCISTQVNNYFSYRTAISFLTSSKKRKVQFSCNVIKATQAHSRTNLRKFCNLNPSPTSPHLLLSFLISASFPIF